MLSLLIMILIMAGLFKFTGLLFHIVGKVFGGILGIIGWLILGVIAVSILGLALYIVPIVLIVGVVALVAAGKV